MRAGIVANVTRADRHRLEAIVSDRSAPQKHVWRANIILATAAGCGTAEIMRRSGKSKPVVWRWQARFMAEGVEGLSPLASLTPRLRHRSATERPASCSFKIPIFCSSEKRLRFMLWSLSWARAHFNLN
jgi:Homeodomain-like domain-containing protein